MIPEIAKDINDREIVIRKAMRDITVIHQTKASAFRTLQDDVKKCQQEAQIFASKEIQPIQVSIDFKNRAQKKLAEKINKIQEILKSKNDLFLSKRQEIEDFET